MHLQKFFLFVLLTLFSFINIVQAGDFDWLEKLSIEARADGSGIKTKLAARFNLGGAKVNAVLSNVNGVDDAYMVMRLGEMSGHDTDYVLQQYKANKGKGWGVIARRVGIKPGSREFQNLKRDHDRHISGSGKGNTKRGKGQSRGKGQGKNKENGQGKGKGRGNH